VDSSRKKQNQRELQWVWKAKHSFEVSTTPSQSTGRSLVQPLPLIKVIENEVEVTRSSQEGKKSLFLLSERVGEPWTQ